MSGYYSVRNWSEFQHYKDRNPPWIKLHRDLLRDYDFACLQDASKLLLIELWLLASQLDNKIPNDPKWIARQLPYDGTIDLKPLISTGFITLVQDASNTLAECKQSAIGETETETETETEQTARAPVVRFIDPYWKENNLTDEYTAFKKMRQQTRKPINDVAASRLVTKHKKLVEEGSDPAEIINLATERCWASFFPARKDANQRVPDANPEIIKLAKELKIELPPGIKTFDARRLIANKAGMQL